MTLMNLCIDLLVDARDCHDDFLSHLTQFHPELDV